jgi:hypothetical protein
VFQGGLTCSGQLLEVRVGDAFDLREHFWIYDMKHVEELAGVALLRIRHLLNERKLIAEAAVEGVGNCWRIRSQIRHPNLLEQELLPRE